MNDTSLEIEIAATWDITLIYPGVIGNGSNIYTNLGPREFTTLFVGNLLRLSFIHRRCKIQY